ncbi:MAG: hypothetical protein N2171_03185 [Clostridia bacterium]|nr:hypothetical protein [Clostridia bacterium]
MKKSIIFIILITVSAVVFYGVRYVKAPVNTQTAYITKIEETVSGNAFIVKNELVHTSQTDGTIYRYIAEGERVGKNRRIATVYEGNVNTDALQELNNIEKKIQLVKSENASSQAYSTESASEESRVAICRDNILDAVYSKNISKIASYKEMIKSIRSGEYQENDNAQLEELEKKKQSLESGIGNVKNDIYSKISGVFVPCVDGYEQKLTPNSIKDFTVSAFEGLDIPSSQNVQTNVKKGDGVCKIVDNSVWYAMIEVDANQLAPEYSVGSSVTVKFDALLGAETTASIYNISTEENGKIILTIKCEKYLDGIFSLRYSRAKVILKSYTGFKVPIYAVRVEDGKKGVLVEKSGAPVFKPCEILYTNDEDGFVIIQPEKNSKNPLEPMDRIFIGEK